jgi:peptide/nickel transport system permease protein
VSSATSTLEPTARESTAPACLAIEKLRPAPGSRVRLLAFALLLLLFAAALAAGWISPAGYAAQFRDAAGAAPSLRFPFGTDDLGRDLFARSLFGMRFSLALAAGAALLATAVASLFGIVCGYYGGMVERALAMASSLLMSLPWLFLLLVVRALLPLDLPAEQSAWATFLLLALLGWAPAARMLAESTRVLRDSPFISYARAQGAGPGALLLRHVLPNLGGSVCAQFLILLPGFILAEAILGFLGLGVAEPMPSWGAMLRDLEDYSAVAEQPWRLAPLAMLVATVLCLECLAKKERAWNQQTP